MTDTERLDWLLANEFQVPAWAWEQAIEETLSFDPRKNGRAAIDAVMEPTE